VLRTALDAGRAEIAGRLEAEPGRGRVIAASYAFLSDQIVRPAYDLVVQRLLPPPTEVEADPGVPKPPAFEQFLELTVE